MDALSGCDFYEDETIHQVNTKVVGIFSNLHRIRRNRLHADVPRARNISQFKTVGKKR